MVASRKTASGVSFGLGNLVHDYPKNESIIENKKDRKYRNEPSGGSHKKHKSKRHQNTDRTEHITHYFDPMIVFHKNTKTGDGDQNHI